ncbi:hypothetical protein D9M69_635560 [compost metagenome]
MTDGDRAARRAMALACAGLCWRMMPMSVRSESARERVRKMAAIEIGMLPIKAATGSGTWGHCDSAAAA